MPAVVGAVNIQLMLNSSVFHTGDVFWIAPKDQAALFAGGGSYTAGEKIEISTGESSAYLK